ncbi:unnamed protein product [Adineta ricciae]|uniref:Kringle domain-containing protein n=1 Tax=Adineta ricciae TaxID=249248 RepID=A0A814A9L1_ADIRI|nr:unnamed protein product [Adineta ricciae]CAF0910433.1 unnamed protein product [Adineta ricciae]
MFLRVLIVCTIVACVTSTPTIVRSIADCSITEDGITHYSGQQATSKFGEECELWSHLQTVFPSVVTEPNFFNDASVKEAKDYCRNPNNSPDGPWCYVLHSDKFEPKPCGVCESLTTRPTSTTYHEEAVETATDAISKSFFENLRDEIMRIGGHIRSKFLEFIERFKAKFA